MICRLELLLDPECCDEASYNDIGCCLVIRGKEEFQTADHSAYLQEGRSEVQKRSVLQAEESLTETLAGTPVQGTHCLRRVTKMGVCLTVHPSTINGTELDAQEWQDFLFLRYVIELPDPPKYCNG